MNRNHMQTRSCNYSCKINNNCKNDCEWNNHFETACQCVKNINDCGCNDCECGFDEEKSLFPTNPMFGQSYVPIQEMDKTFIPCVGLKVGTIFPELVSPYMPGQSQEEIEFIAARNTIKEGCNKC